MVADLLGEENLIKRLMNSGKMRGMVKCKGDFVWDLIIIGEEF